MRTTFATVLVSFILKQCVRGELIFNDRQTIRLMRMNGHANEQDRQKGEYVRLQKGDKQLEQAERKRAQHAEKSDKNPNREKLRAGGDERQDHRQYHVT